jgi:hypothetical protein
MNKNIPPAGLVLHRVEMIVDGGRVFDDGGGGEIDLALPPHESRRSLLESTVTVSRLALASLPIGARVVLQLEVLPGAPKTTSKTPTKKRGRR